MKIVTDQTDLRNQYNISKVTKLIHLKVFGTFNSNIISEIQTINGNAETKKKVFERDVITYNFQNTMKTSY